MEKLTNSQLTVFEQKQIRSTEHEGELWFSITDVVEVLTDSPQPSSYWNKVKKGILKENQSLPFWQTLKLLRQNGKTYPSDCANTEGVLRIIQSVPSPKAEPFKMWLAGLGKQAIDETANPELSFERLTELYKAKGHTDEWIKNRIQSLTTRKELTDEWKKRGVKEGQEYSILTATIAKETFGLTPSEHAQHKGLQKENLRDHMTSLELIFTALGEASTVLIAEKNDAQGFEDNHEAAAKGGRFAGDARKRLEKQTGAKVISTKNFLKKDASDDTQKLKE
jgi:DNA-damage-inducible protein D